MVVADRKSLPEIRDGDGDGYIYDGTKHQRPVGPGDVVSVAGSRGPVRVTLGELEGARFHDFDDPDVVAYPDSIERVGASEFEPIKPTVIEGDTEALAKLKKLAKQYNVSTDGAASIFERWVSMGMAGEMGITEETAVEARKLHEAAKNRLSDVPDVNADDNFLYHVTTPDAAEAIEEEGLLFGFPPNFSGYGGHSANRVFFTERSGVNFWREKLTDQYQSQQDDPEDPVVIRVPKNELSGTLRTDTEGTRDAPATAYYIEREDGTEIRSMATETKAVGLNTFDGSIPPTVQTKAVETAIGAVSTVIHAAGDELATIENPQFVAMVRGVVEQLEELLLELEGMRTASGGKGVLRDVKSIRPSKTAAWHPGIPAARRGATNLPLWMAESAHVIGEAIGPLCSGGQAIEALESVKRSLIAYGDAIRGYADDELGGTLALVHNREHRFASRVSSYAKSLRLLHAELKHATHDQRTHGKKRPAKKDADADKAMPGFIDKEILSRPEIKDLVEDLFGPDFYEFAMRQKDGTPFLNVWAEWSLELAGETKRSPERKHLTGKHDQSSHGRDRSGSRSKAAERLANQLGDGNVVVRRLDEIYDSPSKGGYDEAVALLPMVGIDDAREFDFEKVKPAVDAMDKADALFDEATANAGVVGGHDNGRAWSLYESAASSYESAAGLWESADRSDKAQRAEAQARLARMNAEMMEGWVETDRKSLAEIRDGDGDGYIYDGTKHQRPAAPKADPIDERSQKHLTDSREFKSWFGDSKVVDKDGKPMVVFHGSPSKILEKFDDAEVSDGFLLFGPGFYFAESEDFATPYTGFGFDYDTDANGLQLRGLAGDIKGKMKTRRKELKAGGYPTALIDSDIAMMRRIQLLGARESDLEALHVFSKSYGFKQSIVKAEPAGKVYSVYLAIESPFDADSETIKVDGAAYKYRELMHKDGWSKDRIRSHLVGLGHDGITGYEMEGTHFAGSSQVWVAFEPEQIKAVDNNGNFDPESPYIRKSFLWGDRKHAKHNQKDHGRKGMGSPEAEAFKYVPTGYRDERRILKQVSDETFTKVGDWAKQEIDKLAASDGYDGDSPELDTSDEEIKFLMEVQTDSPAKDRPEAQRAFILIEKLRNLRADSYARMSDPNSLFDRGHEQWKQDMAKLGGEIRDVIDDGRQSKSWAALNTDRKHGGPGPHKSGSEQAVHGQKGKKGGVRGKQNSKDKDIINLDNSKGLSRDQMPQVPREHQDEFEKRLKEMGVKITEENVEADQLYPTQKHVSRTRIEHVKEGIRAKVPKLIKKQQYVSSDGYILDGHHRWAAMAEEHMEIPIKRIDMEINELLEFAGEFNDDLGLKPKAISDFSRVIDQPSSEYPIANPDGRDTYEQFLVDADSRTFTKERRRLHKAIIDKTLDDGDPDEDNKQFIILGGGAASGKSTLIHTGRIDGKGMVIINADDIKGDLPEHRERLEEGDSTAAAHAHEESSYLSKEIMKGSAAEGFSYMLDGTGDSTIEKLEKKTEVARKNGYPVVAEYVTVDTETAIARNKARAQKTGRMVPPSALRHAHEQVSAVFPIAIEKGLFDSARLWDTNDSTMEKDATDLVVEYKDGKLTIHHEEKWQRFLDKAKGK